LKKHWTEDARERVLSVLSVILNLTFCLGPKEPCKRSLMACELIHTPSFHLCSQFLSVRERLKEVLRQYEFRERHFECVIRSKELEVLLSRARAAEQKQLAEGQKTHAEKAEEEVMSPSLVSTDRLCSSSGLVAESSAQEEIGGRTEWSNHAH
jgi:hypothetical protein